MLMVVLLSCSCLLDFALASTSFSIFITFHHKRVLTLIFQIRGLSLPALLLHRLQLLILPLAIQQFLIKGALILTISAVLENTIDLMVVVLTIINNNFRTDFRLRNLSLVSAFYLIFCMNHLY